MHVTSDFRDILALLEKHSARYLVIGGFAFAFHAFPRYTKDLDILVDPALDNLVRVNQALAEFGSPHLLEAGEPWVILQLGVEPNRIDILVGLRAIDFDDAWEGRIRGAYAGVEANWIGLDGLIQTKQATGKARHEADVEHLEKIRTRLRHS